MKLIYVMDALCGWCHGNVQNMNKLYDRYHDRIEFTALPGGMWTGQYAAKSNPQLVEMIKSHDVDVSRMTGASFPAEYQNNVLDNPEHVFNSEPPSRAIITFNQIKPENGFMFAEDVIELQFVAGKDLNMLESYLETVEKYGVEKELFGSKFESDELKQATQAVFAEVHRMGVTGFPTLFVDLDGQIRKLAVGYAPFEQLDQKVGSLIA